MLERSISLAQLSDAGGAEAEAAAAERDGGAFAAARRSSSVGVCVG